MTERPSFIARTASPENVRYEAEETRLYWQKSVLESTKDCAHTKTLVAEMPSDRETEI